MLDFLDPKPHLKIFPKIRDKICQTSLKLREIASLWTSSTRKEVWVYIPHYKEEQFRIKVEQDSTLGILVLHSIVLSCQPRTICGDVLNENSTMCWYIFAIVFVLYFSRGYAFARPTILLLIGIFV